MGLNLEDGNIKRYAFIFTIYLYYLVYQTWSCTLVQVSVVQSSASTPPTSVSPPPPPHTHTLCWLGKGLGVNEKSLCMGEPLPNFFSVCWLGHFPIFQACASCIGERFSVQICASVWLGIIQAFNWWCSIQICPILPAFVDHIKQFWILRAIQGGHTKLLLELTHRYPGWLGTNVNWKDSLPDSNSII